jgi:Flp pilus assembly protein TadD
VSSVDEEFKTALEHFQAGRHALADSICQQLTTLAPEFAGAWHLRGVLAGVGQRPDLAEQFIARAIKLQPSVAQFHFNLAGALQQQKKFEAAKAAYIRCLQLAPQHVAALRNLGIIHLQQSDPKSAISFLPTGGAACST